MKLAFNLLGNNIQGNYTKRSIQKITNIPEVEQSLSVNNTSKEEIIPENQPITFNKMNSNCANKSTDDDISSLKNERRNSRKKLYC